MSDYTKATNFTAKDQLPAGSGGAKLILGADWDLENAAVQTAVATKYDSTDLSDQSTAEAGTDNTVLMTPLRTVQYVANQNDDRGLNYDQDNWDIDYVSADIDASAYSSYTAIQSSISLALAGQYEFEWHGWVTRDTNVLLNLVLGNFSFTPTSWVLGMQDAPNSAFNIFYDDDDTGTGIRMGGIDAEMRAVVRGIIVVPTATTFDIQVKRSYSSGSSGALDILKGSFARTRLLVDNT